MEKTAVKKASKKGKISPENIEESEKLRALWVASEAERKKRGIGTQERFGSEYDIGNQAAVGFFLNGKSALSVKAAAGFARGLGCHVRDFSPRLAKIVEVPAQIAGWPFPDIDQERFEKLSPTAKIELQGVVRERIEAYEKGATQRPFVASRKRQRAA